MDVNDAIQYEAANDWLIQIVAYFGRPKWLSHYLAWKVKRKYKKYEIRMEWSKRFKGK